MTPGNTAGRSPDMAAGKIQTKIKTIGIVAAGFGLFGYIQLFVISNGVNTKYYANNPVAKRDSGDEREGEHLAQV